MPRENEYVLWKGFTRLATEEVLASLAGSCVHARGWGPINCPVRQLGASTVPNLVRKAWRTPEERLVFSCVGRLKELGTKASKARWQWH